MSGREDEDARRRLEIMAELEAARAEAGLSVDVEAYVLGKIQATFADYPYAIDAKTSWRELDRHCDVDLMNPGWITEIEEELGIELDDKALWRAGKTSIGKLVELVRKTVEAKGESDGVGAE